MGDIKIGSPTTSVTPVSSGPLDALAQRGPASVDVGGTPITVLPETLRSATGEQATRDLARAISAQHDPQIVLPRGVTARALADFLLAHAGDRPGTPLRLETARSSASETPLAPRTGPAASRPATAPGVEPLRSPPVTHRAGGMSASDFYPEGSSVPPAPPPSRHRSGELRAEELLPPGSAPSSTTPPPPGTPRSGRMRADEF
jgi:hypothetical protein